MAYQQIRYERRGRVARLTLSRPEVRNAQSRVLLEELDAAFAEAAADDRVRAVVLAGSYADGALGQIARSDPLTLRLTKQSINQAQDAMGYRTSVQPAHTNFIRLVRARQGASRRRGTPEGRDVGPAQGRR